MKGFRIDDVLSFGWEVMKRNFGFFAGLLAVAFGIQMVLSMIPVIGGLASNVFSIVFSIGFIRIALGFCDQQKLPFGTLFNGWDRFWCYLGGGILYALIIFGGMLLLIIPGIIFSVMFQFVYYFVVEHHLGPVDALKASAMTTKGVRLKLFGFGLLLGLINVAGLLCLLVGVFVTMPTIMVAGALTYRHLVAQTPELAEFGINVGGADLEAAEPGAVAQLPIQEEPVDDQENPGHGAGY